VGHFDNCLGLRMDGRMVRVCVVGSSGRHACVAPAQGPGTALLWRP
jgi:hypothetical protein